MRAALVCLLLAGCPKPSSPFPDVTEARKLAPPPREVSYTRVNVAGPFDLPNVPIVETWEGPSFSDDQITYDVTATNASTGRVLDVTRVVYGPGGYGYLGTVERDGTIQRWDPMQVVLPMGAKVGDSWEGEHRKGASLSIRSCEILEAKVCDRGLVVVCESKRDGGVVVLRDHFCPDLGWVGFEAMVQTPNQHPMQMWSEEVARDGVPGPVFETPEVDTPEPPDPSQPPPPPVEEEAPAGPSEEPSPSEEPPPAED